MLISSKDQNINAVHTVSFSGGISVGLKYESAEICIF